MSSTPPRRSRPPNPPQSSNALPLVPILIAVVVLGFVIGAGLSLAGKRGSKTVVTNVASVASVAPTRQPTEPPVTPAPSEKPTPVPTDEPPSAAPASEAPSTGAPATHPPATHAPVRRPAAAMPAAPAAPAAHMAATAAPAAAEPRPALPAVTAAAGVASVPRRTAHAPPVLGAETPVAEAPASSDDADSEFAKFASAVVRQYLGAVARGDVESARAAFGPDGASDRLAETGVVDASTRIRHVEARSAGNNVTVNVDLRTATGLYFGQYTVHRTSSGAALITSHAINKL